MAEEEATACRLFLSIIPTFPLRLTAEARAPVLALLLSPLCLRFPRQFTRPPFLSRRLYLILAEAHGGDASFLRNLTPRSLLDLGMLRLPTNHTLLQSPRKQPWYQRNRRRIGISQERSEYQLAKYIALLTLLTARSPSSLFHPWYFLSSRP